MRYKDMAPALNSKCSEGERKRAIHYRMQGGKKKKTEEL